MEAQFKVGKNLIFKVEAKEQADIFQQLASLQEVFGSTQCGLCKSENLRFVVRTVDDSDYHEIRCNDCEGILALSKNVKGGSLYPVKKLKDGVPANINDQPPFDFKTKGWHKFDKDKAAAAKERRAAEKAATSKKK